MVRTILTRSVTAIRVVPFPPPLAREMRRVDADLDAFAAAFGGYFQHHAKPRAIGEAAAKMMRDIRIVQGTCSRKR